VEAGNMTGPKATVDLRHSRQLWTVSAENDCGLVDLCWPCFALCWAWTHLSNVLLAWCMCRSVVRHCGVDSWSVDGTHYLVV
jgi:hypothetical protein